MIIIIVAILIVGAGMFYGGMKYQENKSFQPGGQFLGRQGMRNGNGFPGGGLNRNGFRPISGEIITSDNTSVTVKLADGSSKIVLLTDKTSINKAATASASDLKAGETIAVFGAENTDGSVTAQNIQLNPISRMTVNPTGNQPQ